MSTYQPPGGTPPEQPPYAQPQDPWAGGHEPGVAAAPTDPIPQQAYGQFSQGVATPSVWTQETMAQGGYSYVPRQGGSRVWMYLVVFLAVVVLGGGGGYGAYWLITHRGAGTETPQNQGLSTGPPQTSTTAPDPTPTVVPSEVKVGDCLFNAGTADVPAMQEVPCTKPKSFRVVKIASGASIPEGPDGKFDRDHTSAAVCAGTNSTAWYAWDSSDDKNDYFFCLTVNP
jgi:hypothetical protein